MRKKIVWVVVSCLMALSLVITSCGTGEEEVIIEEEQEEEEDEEEEQEEVIVEEEGLISPETPKYGGTITTTGSDPSGWDEASTNHMSVPTELINEELLQGDWAKGPAGTGETDWLNGFLGMISLETGCLAESWELPDDETIIYNIRKGVYFQDLPPVNGREFTAEDVAWNMERLYTTPTAYLAKTSPVGNRPTSFKALDKYTVEVKVPPDQQGLALMVAGDFLRHYAHEVVDTYGDIKDWKNAVGTGPFMISDYTVGSTITYVKNPSYWMRDPLHPENRLPYIDTVKVTIISDTSTQMAAMRTGKIDFKTSLSWENQELLMKQCPELLYVNEISYGKALWGRMDKEELPFKDIKVRQAMNMAINKQEIVDEYFGGHAELFAYPYPDDAAHRDLFIPLEEMSEAAQELFVYNPEKAIQLLEDAGYPDGFKTVVQAANTGTTIDYLSILQGYLQDVGIDMEIKPMESGAYTSLARARNHEAMLFTDTKNFGFPFRMLDIQDTSDNPAFFKAPETDAAYEAVCAAIGKDDVELNRILREVSEFRIEQAAGVWLPASHIAHMWWPWLQNFHGDYYMGYWNNSTYKKYIWIDTALKKSMGY